MATTEFTPNRSTGFTVDLTTSCGSIIKVEGSIDSTAKVVKGDTELTSNAALVLDLFAYGTQEKQHRNAMNADKKKSHREQAEKHKETAEAVAEFIELRDDTFREGWCSGCFTLSKHHGTDGPAYKAFTYLCDNCGSPTTPCAVPGCQHTANRGIATIATPSYCAEHRHDTRVSLGWTHVSPISPTTPPGWSLTASTRRRSRRSLQERSPLLASSCR